MNPMVIVLICVVFLVVIGTGLALYLSNEAKRKKRMLGMVMGQAAKVSSKKSEADEQHKRRAEIAKKLKEGGDPDAEKKKKATMPVLLGRAGLDISTKKYFMFSGMSCVLFVLLGLLMKFSPFMMVMMLVIGFFGFPRFIVRHLTKRRQKQFLAEFPDALEAMVRLLKAGMPVAEAISMISREFTGPIGEEMSRVYNKQKIGIPLHEAAAEAGVRMPLPEVKMFATGLAIQAQTGSSLSEVLQNLSGVIRARFKLKRKIKALSSEAIASASIIGALPILLALGMYFANRDYIMILFNEPFGNVLLACAVVWMSIGIIVMKVMINFKI